MSKSFFSGGSYFIQHLETKSHVPIDSRLGSEVAQVRCSRYGTYVGMAHMYMYLAAHVCTDTDLFYTSSFARLLD